jgi:hypothetical protein
MHPICIKECAPKIVPHILCPKMWACIAYIWVKGKHICTTLLVVKYFIWGTIEILDFLWRPNKVTHYKTNIMFWGTTTTNYYGLQIGIFIKGIWYLHIFTLLKTFTWHCVNEKYIYTWGIVSVNVNFFNNPKLILKVHVWTLVWTPYWKN